MRLPVVALLAVGALGCGGGERHDADLDPTEVATRWVDALNERDYRRACSLSVRSPSSELSCEGLLEDAHGDVMLEPPEAVFVDSSSEQAAGLFSASRKGGGPPVKFRVEEQNGRYLVHFEVSVIR